MEDADRATILRQLPDLLRAVQLTPLFTSQLLRLRVLTPDGLEELEAEPVQLQRRRRLLLEVPRRGPRAFDGLVCALLESGQLAAARLLRPSLTLADLSVAAAAAVSAAATPSAPPARGVPHCVPTTPVHPPPQPAPRPPAEHQQPGEDRTDAPGPNLTLRPAERVLGNDRDSYRMMSRPRGLALVISNIRFRDTDLHDKREGGELDEVALPSLLEQLGFQVKLERDLNRSQLDAAIAAFAKDEAHAAYDMAVLAVLTHGGQHVIYGIDSRPLVVEQVIGRFSHEAAPHLAGKPKWLLFQACRGADGNRAVRVVDPNRQATDGRPMAPAPQTQKMAEFGDIYLTFSTIPGYVSMRDLDYGTWLVQVLCKVFAEFAQDRTLQELHTIVHDRMNDIVTSKNEKQTIETSQRGWRKKLYFNPGI